MKAIIISVIISLSIGIAIGISSGLLVKKCDVETAMKPLYYIIQELGAKI